MKKMTRMLAVGCVLAVGVGCGGEMEAVGAEGELSAVEQGTTFTGSYGGKTYRFNRSAMSWPQARTWCQSVAGFDLVILNSSAEELWVRGQIAAGYHLGMSDTAVEGTWRWLNGVLVNSAYTNWLPGSPNQNGDEDCGYSDPFWNWQWDDQTCSTSTPYPKAVVCEN